MDKGTDTFDRDAFGRLDGAEAGHFWFEGRRRLIEWAMRRYFPIARSFCEVGCGTGFVLAGFESRFPNISLTGLEYYPEALPFASGKLARTALLSGDIRELPFREEFDVVGCFDVLEHIPDDLGALAGIAQSIRTGGGVILTVPQHPSLWSVADDIGLHRRRYTRRELAGKLQSCGLNCLRMTSFMSILLPVLWLNRKVARGVDDALGELRPSASANFVGHAALSLERHLIESGINFPVGGSLLTIAVRHK